MKLKPKHFEIAETISWFVDRNYYPDFVEPTREQIDIFTQIESLGKKAELIEAQMKIVEPMLNGKANYDLQIKMIHQELKEWIESGWGWYQPMTSILNGALEEKDKCKTYITMLLKLRQKLKDDGGYKTMMNYSGFTQEEKDNLTKRYFK
jgi:hypothetical protein